MSFRPLEKLYTEHEGFVSDKWALYLNEYERLFRPLRDAPVTLLEIGIQNGGSLQIWEKYFPKAERILGCDINAACAQLSYDSAKIELIISDINQPSTLARIFSLTSSFDIVIDDGSHTSGDITQTFYNLFPHLKQGGLFIVEDLHCSYWKDYQGGLFHPRSSMSFLKALADVINREHWGVDLSREAFLQSFGIPPTLDEMVLAEIHSVEFVNSMCIVTKRPTEENRLGKRLIAGQVEQISPVKHLQSSEITVALQEWNGFSHPEPCSFSRHGVDTVSPLEARLYWHERRAENVLDYCETYSAAVVYPINGLHQRLTIMVPDIQVATCGLRLDIANAPAAIILHELSLVDADEGELWRWPGGENAFANPAGVFFFRDCISASLTLFVVDGDPHFDLVLPEMILAAIRPGCSLRLAITPFPLASQLPKVFDQTAAAFQRGAITEPVVPRLTTGLAEITELLKAQLEYKDRQISDLQRQLCVLHNAQDQAHEQLLRAEGQLELLKEIVLNTGRVEPL